MNDSQGINFDDCSGGDFIVDQDLIGRIQQSAATPVPHDPVKGRKTQRFNLEAPEGKLISVRLVRVHDPSRKGVRFQLTLTLEDAPKP
jgi:hypothetical protein